jgi:RHS repeat-associated protein
MEKDDEILGDGNSYTTANREFDSRIGRWWSLDPALRSNVSMYAAFSNNPIIKIDPRGDDDFFDKTGKLIYSTKVGNNIHVLTVSNEQFYQAMIRATPIITAKLKATDQAVAFNHFLESYSAPVASIDYTKKDNYMTIVNIMRHYYSDANLSNNDGKVIDPVDAIGGVVKGDWNAVTYEAPIELQAKPRPINFGKGAIYLTINGAGKINPALNNKNNLISVLVHENAHLKGNAAGDENPQSHLNAYWEEINHESWSKVDLNSEFAAGTIGKIGWLLYQSKDRETLQKKFEDKLGIKLNIEYKAPSDSNGFGTVETTYERK